MDVDRVVLPKMLEGAHCRGGLGEAVVDVKVVSKGVRDVVTQILKVFAERDGPPVR